MMFSPQADRHAPGVLAVNVCGPELAGRRIAWRAVRSEWIFTLSSGFGLFTRIPRRQRPMHVQAFIPETSVACFGKGRGCELSWAAEVLGHLVFIRLVIRRMRDEPAAMVDLNALWHTTKCFQVVHRPEHIGCLPGVIGGDGRALPAEIVDGS